MLENLHVKNLALIRESEIDFGPAFNIMTGETGAGKSVVIGSIALALGDRAGEKVIRDGAEYALIELTFHVDENEKKKIKEMDLPEGDDGRVIIQRRIYKGRTVCRVNGENVTSHQLKGLSSILIDIYGQREHQTLLDTKSQKKVLDDYAGEELSSVTEKIRTIYKEYSDITEELSKDDQDADTRKRQADLARFEVDEIEQADLSEGEDEKLESDFRRMSNAQRISEAYGKAFGLCSTDNDESAGSAISAAIREMKNAASIDDESADLEKQLSDIDGLISDFCRQVQEQMESLSFEPEEFAQIEERLNLVNHLKDKYGKSISDILGYRDRQSDLIERYDDYDNYRAGLEAKSAKLKSELVKLCREATKVRKRYADDLSLKMEKAMADLNFLASSFRIDVVPQEDKICSDGWDSVSYLISTNPGEKLRSLTDTASGGELSRIMLALKTVTAGRDDIGTLIFDEIDTGISGRTAWMAAGKMADLSKRHQIICITHLPQIAAMEDTHFLIEKNVTDGHTVTEIKKLGAKEITAEIARMLGGDKVTESAIKNAGEMISQAKDHKAGKRDSCS